MKNLVFIDIDKLGNGFQEQINDLNELKDNLLSFAEENETNLHFISSKKFEEVKYSALLIMNYFNLIAKKDNNLNMSLLFTKDVITDLGLEGNINLLKDNSKIEKKEQKVIGAVGLDNIETILYLSDRFSVSAFLENEDKKSLVLFEGDEEKEPLKRVGNTILLSSPKKGVSGFNECFDIYKEAKLKSSLTR